MIAGESRNLAWKGEDSLGLKEKEDGWEWAVKEEAGYAKQHSCDVRLC